MKGNDKIIDALNSVLTKELTAINQYFLHAKMLEDWGLARLAAHEHHESIDEMKHADALIGGVPPAGHRAVEERQQLAILERCELVEKRVVDRGPRAAIRIAVAVGRISGIEVILYLVTVVQAISVGVWIVRIRAIRHFIGVRHAIAVGVVGTASAERQQRRANE